MHISADAETGRKEDGQQKLCVLFTKPQKEEGSTLADVLLRLKDSSGKVCAFPVCAFSLLGCGCAFEGLALWEPRHWENSGTENRIVFNSLWFGAFWPPASFIFNKNLHSLTLIHVA